MTTHIPKEGFMYYLSHEDIISEYEDIRIGKLNNNYYAVEDLFTISLYQRFSMALVDFYDNIRINKMIAMDKV